MRCRPLLVLLVSLTPHAARSAGANEADSRYAKSVVLDTGVDATSTSTFAMATLTAPMGTQAVDGGARIRAGIVAGTYRYDASAARVVGTQESADILVGRQWNTTGLTYSFYAGVTGQATHLSPNDPRNPVVGTKVGAKAVFELYAQPTSTTMLSTYASYATANSAYYGRVQYGWRVFDQGYIGPDLVATGDRFYQQFRGGLHFTGFRAGPLQLSVSAGFAQDRVKGSGYYTQASARSEF